jgi:hypothetical protein
MTYLLLKLSVFSKFLKYLAAFGMKTFARDEGYGGLDWRLSKNKDFGTLHSSFILHLLIYAQSHAIY